MCFKSPHPLQLEIVVFVEFMSITTSTHLLTFWQLKIGSCKYIGMERLKIVAGKVGFIIYYEQPSETVAVNRSYDS